jgi:pyruvate/2-oxoglutarate dehydrogenase complex dihydrolipoamide dehydrogenase (E3) component
VSITGDVSVDMRKVKARMKEVSGASNHNVTTWLENMETVDLIRGHARFVDPHSVEINGEVLEAEKIFINVGARARVPDWEGLDEVPFYTSSEMMEIDFLPEHLVIVGGSYIGLEFAQIYRRFGSEVTVIEAGDRIIRRDDEDVSAAVKDILEGEGGPVSLTGRLHQGSCHRVRGCGASELRKRPGGSHGFAPVACRWSYTQH